MGSFHENTSRTACLLLGVLLAAVFQFCPGCQESSTSTPWTSVEESELTRSEQETLQRMLDARDALAKTLKAKLMESLVVEGPLKAIAVCSEVAQPMTKLVGQTYRVQIGRTSFLQRNPLNEPPDWALPFVTDRVAFPIYMRGDDRLAALLPIHTEPQCLVCHGDPNSMDPQLLVTIRNTYPKDRATGFVEGELRGWFWTEATSNPESK